jgi:hypothetical protein
MQSPNHPIATGTHRRSALQHKPQILTLASLLLVIGFAQAQSPATQETAVRPIAEPQPEMPTRTLNFEPQETDPALAVSNVTSLPFQCTSDGTLFLNSVNPKDLREPTLISIRGKKSQTYRISAIGDLHDIFQIDTYPSDSNVGFLIRASKELPGQPGAGKSPAGIPWSKYHNYIALFDRNGSYKESIELPVDYQLNHFAILPSGEFLISGYDRLNSAPRLLFLSSAGQIMRTLDLPAARNSTADASFGSAAAMMASSQLLGNVIFTAWNNHILVWHRGSADPVLDVGPGGSVREVPLQPPPGLVFEAMISANDRWVARFHEQSAAENAPEKPGEHIFYELHPEDASLSVKLIQPKDVSGQIACESSGAYITFNHDSEGKFRLLKAE